MVNVHVEGVKNLTNQNHLRRIMVMCSDLISSCVDGLHFGAEIRSLPDACFVQYILWKVLLTLTFCFSHFPFYWSFQIRTEEILSVRMHLEKH